MGRAYDPARATRERLARLERQATAAREAREVAAGVEESLALSRARGAAFEKTRPEPNGREGAYRRQAGLDWLERKGRLNPFQLAAGRRYGEAFRRAGAAPAIASTLEIQPGGTTRDDPRLEMVLRRAAGRAQAEARLTLYRQRLLNQQDLIAACDLICGRELTPREAGGGEREGARLEAVLKVALDILAQAERAVR